ncbi:PhnD/SsuA/transferrin family substrate-binding protein [Desulfobacterales bacterium HSG17]|nr:PhnD/SsuA/transferrin family substrate-binding protein [Desulfobacterales bacterium HSG17]
MKNVKHIVSSVSLILIISMLFTGYVHADFKIAIMQDKKGAAAKFRPLLNYLNQNGIKVSFAAAKNYQHAAKLFSNGEADAMFSGSGIAGCFIIKGLADPVVRPVSKDGWSTYWAVVLAPENTGRFTQNAEYFNDKRVIFCSLASSGEFFYRSVKGESNIDSVILKAASHGSAIDALSRSSADIAIVKNRVWDNVKEKYNNIVRVGEDPGENPNGTLIVSKKTDPQIVELVASLLLGLENDISSEAKSVKEKLKITGYIGTSLQDFKCTIALLKKAGVDKFFNFSF